VPAGQLLVQRVRQRGSVYPKTKPALVYTSIHSTVTARSSCGDLLRLDSTCGRSGSLVVRRERARSPLEQLSQNIGAGSVGPSTGPPIRSSNEPRVIDNFRMNTGSGRYGATYNLIGFHCFNEELLLLPKNPTEAKLQATSTRGESTEPT
jgi:hypothetical protein